MKTKVELVSRLLLGLVFTVFGANGWLMFVVGSGFLPTPPPPPEMKVIMDGFMATGYLMVLVKSLETIAGVLLLSGRFVNLAIVLLAPIVVNILGIHVFAERSGLPIALVIAALFALLVRSRWTVFAPLLRK